jgi:CheY-like chemotaxis protein
MSSTAAARFKSDLHRCYDLVPDENETRRDCLRAPDPNRVLLNCTDGMNSFSILVADDEDSIRSLVQQLLSSEGHAVVAVGNAREACDAMTRQQFDLVVTDVLMPDGDGIELITQVKQAQPNARILAMSGGGRYVEGSDYLKLASGLGAHAAITKPFTWEQLKAAIDVALAGHPVRDLPSDMRK